MVNGPPHGRYERKYRLNYFTYLQARNGIKAHMRKDSYTKNAGGEGYLVRSLYYDTLQYHAYHQKMNGDNERTKFRIRTYDAALREGTPIRAELKGRRSNLVLKKSSFIAPQAYLHFMKYRHWPSGAESTPLEFERQLHLQDLRPVVITQYYREGYESRIQNDLRITFDHRVSSCQARDLFPAKAFYQQHHPHYVVMEIKFCNEQHKWLQQFVQALGVKSIANSKFTQGIQICRKELHHPGGVVVVR